MIHKRLSVKNALTRYGAEHPEVQATAALFSQLTQKQINHIVNLGWGKKSRVIHFYFKGKTKRIHVNVHPTYFTFTLWREERPSELHRVENYTMLPLAFTKFIDLIIKELEVDKK